MSGKWDEYMRLEGYKEYYIIEAYQYIPIESDRKKVIDDIEHAKDADEAKSIIAKARGENSEEMVS